MRLILPLLMLPWLTQMPAQSGEIPLNDALSWRNIGPANQGGRIVDIEALDGDFTRVWMATGSGGVWQSDNAGTTWKPIFDEYSTASIGDIAVFQQDPNHIWVGTGEANNRNSVSWGDGVFKSSDGGKTFEQVGLESTHQIARVVIPGDDPNEVCVCAIGHLWGTNGERGIFHTTNGGGSWNKLTNGLPNDGVTGCTDLVVDPNNSQVMYTAFYQRLRQPWHFESGGDNGGIFKTTDGGASWTKLSNGLPAGPTGRIGLAIYHSNPDILMALVEAEQTDTLAMPGSGVYRSEDGGASWQYVNTYNNRPFYYSQIRINPLDDQRVYLLTTRFMVSLDGGTTFVNGSEDQEVHGDFHAMWLDPGNTDRYYLGADKGISITHDHGAGFQLFDNLPIAQYYRIGIDYREPYYVYGGLQDNGFYATASFGRDARGILNDHNWKVHWGDGMYTAADPENWRLLFTSAENASINKYDPLTHNIERISPAIRNIKNIRDYYSHEQIAEPGLLRFNWESPMQMNWETGELFVAGNHIYKSTDHGKSWNAISPDITTNDPDKTKYRASGGITPDNSGAETHCAATSLALSSLDNNLMWVGTDDGLVHITRDGGREWVPIRQNIPDVPEGIWVARIEASRHSAARTYIAFDGHRSDINAPFLMVTEDYGATWSALTSDLPANEVIRVVREDPVNGDVLYIGTETGVWASTNRGANWFRFMAGMPTVSVYDLVIHPRDGDIIAGTHGRSLWVMDNVSILQQMNDEVRSSDLHLFDQPTCTLWNNVSRGGQRGHFWYAGENPPEVVNTSSLPRARYTVDALIYFYIGPDADTSDVAIEITDDNGTTYATDLTVNYGLNRWRWKRNFDGLPYTEVELDKVENALSAIYEQFPYPMLREVIAEFKTSESYSERRSIVQRAINAGIADLDPSLGLQTAGPGEYLVQIRVGDQVKSTRLIIREDPLGNEE